MHSLSGSSRQRDGVHLVRTNERAPVSHQEQRRHSCGRAFQERSFCVRLGANLNNRGGHPTPPGGACLDKVPLRWRQPLDTHQQGRWNSCWAFRLVCNNILVTLCDLLVSYTHLPHYSCISLPHVHISHTFNASPTTVTAPIGLLSHPLTFKPPNFAPPRPYLQNPHSCCCFSSWRSLHVKRWIFLSIPIRSMHLEGPRFCPD